MKYRLLSLFILIFALFGTNKACENKPIITIWVHGTRLTPEFVAYNFFHCQPGLNPAINLEQKFHLRSLAELLCTADPEHYSLNNFYLFGWNGKLSSKERRKAALMLHHQLSELINEYTRNYGITPYIRIITHSHGGNVVLYLAEFAHESSITIDELILLACPVQKHTSHLISHSCFKKIYSLFSTHDILQVLDPQGLHAISRVRFDPFPLFSERLFPECSQLKQVQITYDSRSLWHIEFLLSKFVGMLSDLIKQIKDSSDKLFTIDIRSKLSKKI